MNVDDPNGALAGRSLTIAGEEWLIVGTPEWSDGNYVLLGNEDERTIVRPTGIVRRQFELEAS